MAGMMEALNITSLVEVTRAEVDQYAGPSLGAVTIPVFDERQQLYTVIIVPDRPRPFPARVVVMAQVVNDKVVIIEDTTDKPLVDALMQAGVPREKIVLAYAGETAPTENVE